MHLPSITATYLAVLALLYAVLTVQVVRLRQSNRAVFGDSGNMQLRSAIRAHAHFHSTLVRACHSDWLLRMRWTLFEQSERYRSLAVPLAAPTRHLGDEHQAIVRAVMAKDVARAQELIAEHVWTTAQALLDAPALSA